MQFDWWTFGFQVINVSILIWLLSRFLFRPVAGIIAERQAQGARILQEAEATRREAESARAAANALAAKHTAERAEILQAASREAGQLKEAILSEARREAAKITGSAQDKVKRMAARARKSNAGQAKELALVIAERLIENMPAHHPTTGYAERLAGAVRNLHKDEIATVLADADGLKLVSSAPLSAQDLNTIRKALKSAIGREMPLSVETDKDLIAGIELKSRHGVIHNSLKADLDQVARAILAGD